MDIIDDLVDLMLNDSSERVYENEPMTQGQEVSSLNPYSHLNNAQKVGGSIFVKKKWGVISLPNRSIFQQK